MPKKHTKSRPSRLSDRAGQVVLANRKPIRASYDAARTTDENYRHWANADSLSANGALSADVRMKLRNRCRYEAANNSYAKGIGLTLTNDTIGTGPQLHMLTDNPELNTLIETVFWRWAQSIRLAEKLRMARFARYDSGECFVIQSTNPGIDSPVKLDLWIVEAEQIADPTFESVTDDDWLDGIKYDQYGNPVVYRLLKEHPGAASWTSAAGGYDDIAAEYVDHYYRPDRPGQRRGIPDITPAVQLFAELRRYCAAVIGAAETAADFAAVLYSDAPPDSDAETHDVDAMDTIELTRRMATTLPQGWKLGQIKAEQPTTMYGDFVSTKLKEIARCVNVPFTIASMDSSVSNMSAAYVDRQAYAMERTLERADIDRMLDRLLDRWATEAIRIEGFLPQVPDQWLHEWRWPSLGHHADPQKVANAAKTALMAGLTTLPREHAKDGLDWEEQQLAAAKSLGVTVVEYQKMLRQNLFPAPQQSTQPNKDDDDEETTPE